MVIAIIVVTVIGIICAVMLSVASKVMYVEVDERIPAVRECLPGANCGGCGFAGCDGYAAALVEDPELSLTLCAPGGAAAAQAMGDVLGRAAGDMARKLAVVKCRGDCKATGTKMDYEGIQTCKAAKLMFGGNGKCTFGCLGFGDCAGACPSNAICIEDGVARVDTRLCTGCGVCEKTCPNSVISIVPGGALAKVYCSSKDKGAIARKKCTSSCIGCGICMRICPSEAITIVNFLAQIDYDKCSNCGSCVSVCPNNCILG